jgi:lactate racemase
MERAQVERMDYRLPYGEGFLDLRLPDGARADLIVPHPAVLAADPIACIERALDEPSGGFNFDEYSYAQSAAVAVNDKTRPVPNNILLPPLLERLRRLGLPQDRIRLIVASGTHTPMRQDELARILPEDILAQYPVSVHDCDAAENMVDLGVTSRGTHVQANREFMQADLRIVVGDVEPHHFMGYSGGVKSAAIGLAARETIRQNHAMLTQANTSTGHYLDNPMRQDVEEIGRMMGVSLAENAILDLEKKIVYVVAGQPEAVMQAAIPLSRQVCQVKAHTDYDLVIASAGGAPKDINFYQAQKGMTHAAMLARDGGTVILVAACPEGVGSQPYEQWMRGLTSQTQVFERFNRDGFQIGPHKAFLVARIASRVRVMLFSEIAAQKVAELLIEPVHNLQAAALAACVDLPENASIAVMPYAVNTVPFN